MLADYHRFGARPCRPVNSLATLILPLALGFGCSSNPGETTDASSRLADAPETTPNPRDTSQDPVDAAEDAGRDTADTPPSPPDGSAEDAPDADRPGDAKDARASDAPDATDDATEPHDGDTSQASDISPAPDISPELDTAPDADASRLLPIDAGSDGDLQPPPDTRRRRDIGEKDTGFVCPPPDKYHGFCSSPLYCCENTALEITCQYAEKCGLPQVLVDDPEWNCEAC